MIAKVILEGTTKYSFYTPIIDTGIDYGELRGITNEVAITRLYEFKNKTFKDYLHHVIDNLVSYLQNDTVSSNSGVLVGTNNYNFVWEHIVAHGLGSDFTKADGYQIGSYQKYDGTKGSSPRIELDHVNRNHQIIVDSKYYNDRDEEKADYKQLYYNYHMAFLDMESNNLLTYQQALEEYSKWSNILVKPSTEEDYKFSCFKFKDQMKLYSIKININKYVEYYVEDKCKSQLVHDIAHNLELENLQDILNEAQS